MGLYHSDSDPFICDPLEKTDHSRFRVLGMDQRRLYCRVQWSKSQALNSFRVGQKIVHGSPVPQFTIFRETECFVCT